MGSLMKLCDLQKAYKDAAVDAAEASDDDDTTASVIEVSIATNSLTIWQQPCRRPGLPDGIIKFG
jgi:hypothetical protein